MEFYSSVVNKVETISNDDPYQDVKVAELHRICETHKSKSIGETLDYLSLVKKLHFCGSLETYSGTVPVIIRLSTNALPTNFLDICNFDFINEKDGFIELSCYSLDDRHSKFDRIISKLNSCKYYLKY